MPVKLETGSRVGVDSPKYPGWWTITAVATTGRRLVTVQPADGNRAARGVRVPPEILIGVPYERNFDAAAVLLPGTVVEFVPSTVARKPSFRGLWVVTSERGEKVTVYRLGGSDVRIPGAHRRTLTVVKPEEIAAALQRLGSE